MRESLACALAALLIISAAFKVRRPAELAALISRTGSAPNHAMYLARLVPIVETLVGPFKDSRARDRPLGRWARKRAPQEA